MVSEEARRRAAEAIVTYEDEVLPLGSENLDEGRSCTTCGGDEYTIVDGSATCRLREHTNECRRGGRIVVHAVTVEIGGTLPFTQTLIIEASCTHCDVVGENTAANAVYETAPVETETFELDAEVFVEKHPLHRHHVSYVPEETVLVCATCHSQIHDDDRFRPDLTPGLSRSEWEAMADA